MENKSIPDIRFAEFTVDWEQRKLRELCDEFKSGKNIKSEDIRDEGRYPVFGGNGLRGYTNTYNHDGLYALIGRQGALCGNMNISYGKAYFTEHAIAVKGNKNNETRFLYYLLGKMNLGQYSGQSAQPGLAVNKLIELSAFIPTFAEQAQISALFKDFDILIDLYQQELTILKQTKHGFLQKMFPKERESVPEIRFKGLTEDWEERKLKDIVDLLKDGTHGTHKDGEDAFLLSAKNIKNGQIVIDEGTDRKISSDDYNLIFKNYELMDQDLLITIVGTIGQTALYKESTSKLAFQRSVAIIRGNKDVNQDFLKSTIDSNYVQKQLSQSSSMSAQAGVYLGDLEKLTIKTPKLSEQIKIGNFFKQLDDTITLHHRELNALKETKKAFLQKMFV